MCPPIPEVALADCYTEQVFPTTNGQLLEQWIDYRACASEQSIKLKVIRGLAECRVNASK